MTQTDPREAELRARFERLLDGQAYARAWGYCRRLADQAGGGRADAEDLLQEALVHAWRGISSLRDDGAFLGWLLAIARRRHLTRLARAKRERELDSQLGSGGILPLSGQRLESAATEPQSLAVLEVLAQLPAGPRELLSLFYLHGLSALDTARALGIAPRAVRMRLTRARAMLRRRLDPAHPTNAEHPARRTI